MTDRHLWWQRGIIYQVYPRSFMDSDGDGIGDLAGIAGKLDYLRDLGVDAIWLSPIFPSPMADFGYDVANYTDIHPLFGTLADFDELLAAAHARGLKVILDFVPNHTSDQHPWFVESRTSRNTPKRDWYLWRDPAPDGGPPTNWESFFGGSAWEYDAATGQYYCHLFLKEQPDLNWRNPEVQAAMLDVLRFWLDRGVDGFRVDVIWVMIKDDQYRDNPPNPDYDPTDPLSKHFLPVYTADRPEVHDIIAMMRHALDQYAERLLIGEIYLPIERLVTYYGVGGAGVHMPYNFQLILLPWDAETIGKTIDVYETALPPDGWPNWVLGNHDQPRLATRIGADQTRVAAMLLLTLRGTPTMYYGDEIGMHDVPIPREQQHDPQGLSQFDLPSRDPERTPMQWDDDANGGFTTGTPWLPIAGDYRAVNVRAADADPASLLTLYRRLIALRRTEPVLEVGRHTGIAAGGDLLAYLRDLPDSDRRLLIALNFSAEPRTLAPANFDPRGRVLLATGLDREGEEIKGTVALRANEGLIIELGV